MKIGYETYQELLRVVLERLRAKFDKDEILSFAVFGSVARGEATGRSDIDILVVHKPVSFNPIKRFTEMLIDLRESGEYSSYLSMGLFPAPYPVFMTEEELSENPLILLDVLDHGIILYDRGDFLRQELDRLRARLKELGSKRVELDDGSWYWDLKPDWKSGEIIEIRV